MTCVAIQLIILDSMCISISNRSKRSKKQKKLAVAEKTDAAAADGPTEKAVKPRKVSLQFMAHVYRCSVINGMSLSGSFAVQCLGRRCISDLKAPASL